MKSNGLGRIQFINTSDPGNAISAEEKRRANSHAARTAHAKIRRLRTIEYQAEKGRQEPEGTQEALGRSIAPRSSVQPTPTAVETEQLVLISPVSLLASSRRDPFQSFARSFKPIEHFLLDHYVRAVIPYMNQHCNKLRDPERYVDLMTKEWVRLTLTNVGALSGIFLAACRHLFKNQPEQQQYYLQLSIEYKLSCVRALREAIASEIASLISDSSVAIVILLAYDELQLGDLTTSRRHVQGMIQMVEHNGGPQALGLNGFLEHLVCKFVGNDEFGRPLKASKATLCIGRI
ncbi:MAG: hypothetical protein M1818_006348 [Claussenomyces sp. TS43310]|nr:MAG: hypothetical protein M1818_006348 [Claussenomyces sp. TS43310]